MKSWYIANSPYQLQNWLKPSDDVEEIIYGFKEPGSRWNKKAYLVIEDNKLIVQRKDSNCYYGAIIYLEGRKDSFKWSLFYFLKEFVKCKPLIINGQTNQYIYLKEKSKMDLLIKKLGVKHV